MSLLALETLTAAYGVSQALFGVDLVLNAGEVTALLGRNGMGKSTTVKAICRMIHSEGVLRFDGHNLHGLLSHRVARLGIGLVPEANESRSIPNRCSIVTNRFANGSLLS